MAIAWDPTYWGEAFFSLYSDSQSHSLSRTTFLQFVKCFLQNPQTSSSQLYNYLQIVADKISREHNERTENIALSK
jgi:hypothetical protein